MSEICCDICLNMKHVRHHFEPGDRFVDGKTQMGPWANMCLTCHRRYGVGLGTGKGQLYVVGPDGSWETVEKIAG